MAYSLQARFVYPVDGPPIEGGIVTVEGERIVAVGTTADAGTPRDLGDVALLPALVNAHTHLEFSHLRRPLGRHGMPFVDWIRLIIAERGRDAASVAASIERGAGESVAAGVSTLGEIATADAAAYVTDHIRATLFCEVIGFSRLRAASALKAVDQRLAELQPHLEKAAGALQAGLSPHAPYTVSPTLLRELVKRSAERGLPMAMHLAESQEELQLLASGKGPFQELLEERSMWDPTAIPLGSRPLDYLQIMAAAPRSLIIHGNYLDNEEQAFLAKHRERMSVVYCPRTHAYFGHTRYPLAELLAAGVRVALGTDSRASNPDLNLLGDIRCVAQEHPSIPPATTLRMGTLAGAAALGRESDIGSITPGKSADLIAVPFPWGIRRASDDVLEAIIHTHQRPSAIWHRGREVAIAARA